TGIALGAAAGGRVATTPHRAAVLFALSQFGIAIASAFVYSGLQFAVSSVSSHVLLAYLVILPSTLFIGATFPFAVRAVAAHTADAGRATAVVYSWNTIGAIVGALAGGFYLIPRLGFAGAAQFAVCANLLIGVIAISLSVRVPGMTLVHYRHAAALIVLAVFTAVSFEPGRPVGLMSQPLFGSSSVDEVIERYYAVGRSSTVYLVENSQQFGLTTNGLPEAQIEFRGSPPRLQSQRWLGLWPSLARPDVQTMLIVGLGGGVVLEGVPPSVGSVDVVELEQEVVNANVVIGGRRNVDPLRDSRFRIIINDARNALRLTNRRYDAIVSQPSHPWTSGAANLYTREFFSLARNRLNDEGVFVQWMNADLLDEKLLRRMAATLLAEFQYVRVYQPSTLALHFVASNSPLNIESGMARTGRPLVDSPLHFARNGIQAPIDVTAAWLLDEMGVRDLAANAAPITDDDNRMAIDSKFSATGLSTEGLTFAISALDPLLQPESEIRQSLSERDLVYVARRLLQQRQFDRVSMLS
ncbi:MAG: fused MFS/spermidine synthase, partial [Woeseiaceae bacterium]